jgi:hypothetical protein
VSRAKTQRPKPRGATHADKRRATSTTAAPAPFDDIAHAIDSLDAMDFQIDVEAEAPSLPRGRTRGGSGSEIPADDLVVELEEIVPLRSLAIAVHDGAPHVATARTAIAAAGHTVASGATGRDGLDQIRHALRNGTVDALLVGLPGGESLIETALALAPNRPVVIASCTGSTAEAVRRAAELGADLVTVRPHDLERLAPVLLAAVRLADARHDSTHARGSEAAIRARLEALAEPELGTLQPFELFARVLELELKRASRYHYPISVALFAVDVEDEHAQLAGAESPEPPPGVRGILRARAGNALIHSIRDIDTATEVEQERFLVLLPYTDLAGAAGVASRIIATVSAGDPVIAAGRRLSARIVGAVAGAAAGQPLSFERLMHDATRALEQAQRDGAELALPAESSEDA